MKEIKIITENKEFFKKKAHLSDFECWALMSFANSFGYAEGGEWWWYDSSLYADDRTCLWLTENGNVMLEVVDDDRDDLYVIRF